MSRIAVAFLRTFEGSRFLEGISHYRRDHLSIDLREIASLSDDDQAQYLLNQQIEGVITLTSDDRAEDQAVLRRFPGKVINLSTELTIPGCCCLKWDLQEGLSLLENHFRSIQVDTLAYVGSNSKTCHQVVDSEFGISSHKLLQNNTADGPAQDHLAELGRWLNDLPKRAGVICENGEVAAQCVSTANSNGHRIPHEIAFASLNGRRETLLACQPPVTAIEQPYLSIGAEAVRMMEAWISSEKSPPPMTLMKGATLQVRGSTRAYPDEIEVALEYISKNAHRGITVLNVVRETQNVSRVTFERNFKAAVGETPGEVIRRAKLLAGEKYLRELDCSVSEVAHRSGFESVSQFSLQFRRWKGISPAAFRKGAQGNSETPSE